MRRETKSLLDELEDELLFAEDPDDEEEDEEDEEDEDDSSDEDEEDDSEDDEEDDEEDEGKKKPKKKASKNDEDDDNEALLSALRKERKARKEAEKREKALRAEVAKRTNKPKPKSGTSDDAKAQREAEEATQRVTRLAEGLRTQAEDQSISRWAREFNFLDEADVLRLLDRDDLDVEQDEDDPSKVTVDENATKRAVKRLAKQKPHLVKAQESKKKKDDEAEDEEEEEAPKKSSPSKFKGPKSKGKRLDDEKIRQNYPALARRGRK